MDTSDHTTIPTKRCSKCGETFPATTDLFYKKERGLYGLFSWCKKCHLKITTPSANNWNKANPDKLRASRRRWREANPDKHRDCTDNWNKNNPERRRFLNKRWAASNPDRRKEAGKRWQKANPEKLRANNQRRYARKKSLAATFTSEDWNKCLNYFHGACAYCCKSPSFFDIHWVLHQEHHLPLNRGGGYIPKNIVPACQSCNFEKHDSDPVEWCVKRFGRRKAKTILKRIQDYFSSLH